ncbi:hypothetical protein BX600DRAFT_551752 [Xylariales sp. PMI_506]|nr:hypothetical protein BX600DRAFT_551752 [Xylariales sp. PMI_506]
MSSPGQNPIEVTIDASIWSMYFVSTIFIGLRLYTRGVRVGHIWWDDYLLVASWILTMCSSALLTEMVHIGYMYTVMSGNPITTLTRCAHTCHLIALALSKTAFATMLLRFSSKWQKYVIWFIIGSIAIVFTVHIFGLWKGFCPGPDPYSIQPCWDSTNPIKLNIISSMYSGLTDFVLAALPWKVIMSLQMKKSERISVAIAMSVGIVAGITGIMKSIQSFKTLDFTNPNFIRDLELFWIFTLAEPNATIIAASIPVLRVLFKAKLHEYGGSSSRGGPGGAYLRSTNNKFHSQFTSTVRGTADAANLDNGSDRSILQKDGKDIDGITRTRMVTVTYDEASMKNDGAPDNDLDDAIEMNTRFSSRERNLRAGPI